jgi:hypothetical protein
VSEKQVFRVLYLTWLVAVGMLGIAIAGTYPYAFYTQLRWICCIVFIYSAFAFTYSAVDVYQSCRKDPGVALPVAFHLVIAVVFAAGALLFNPIIPFHFRRETWLLLDKISLGVVIFLGLIGWSKLEPPTITRRWFKWLAWLVVAGLVVSYTAEETIHLYGKYVLATTSTTATVVAMREQAVESDTGQSGVISTGRYKFKVNGKAYYGATHRYDVGDKLVVRYNQANPNDNRDPTEGFRSDFETLVLIAIILGALYFWLKWILNSEKRLAQGRNI